MRTRNDIIKSYENQIAIAKQAKADGVPHYTDAQIAELEGYLKFFASNEPKYVELRKKLADIWKK